MANLELFGVPISDSDPKDRLRGALRGVKAIIFDVDGVLTDGQISFTESGEEIRTFSIRDGLAFREALARGMKLGAISERDSKAALRWLNEFGVTDVVLGADDKLSAYEQLKLRFGLQDDECAYIGDDINDIPVLERAGVSVTPVSGIEYLRNRVQYVSGYEGGKGCVREIVEMVLALQEKWEYFDE